MGALLAALLVLVASTAGAAGDASADDLARARERIAEAQQRVDAARGELGAGQARLRDAETAVARVTRELRDIRARERALAKKLAQMEAERDALVRKAQAQADALTRDLRDAWMLGQQTQLRLWLNADDPQRVARVSRYYDYLNRDRAQRLAAYRESRAALAALQDQVVAEQQQLAQARASLAERERVLADARNERKTAVASLATELRARSDELKRRQEDEAALRRLSTTVREAFRDVPPEAVGAPLKQRKGKLRWPAAGRLAAGYGSPLAEGKLALNGILIAAAEGTDVRAVHPGRVVYADWLRGYGLLVILDHGDGFLTIYGHNQALARTTGDWVKEGETIAAVGATGGRPAPGLYFEIRSGGEPQDPMRWLRK